MLHSFDDRKKTLLYHMKRIIQSEMEVNDKNDIRDYGIKNYEYVWEYMINELFGEQEKKKYYPDATYHIEGEEEFKASKLRPDTVFKDSNNNFYILDSKYYKASTISKNRKEFKRFLPTTDSIQKQITYGDFILKNFKEEENINNIYNAFIIPYNKENNNLNKKNNIENIGYATCNWKDLKSIDEKYLKIQIILIDTKYLMDSYFNKKAEIDLLINKIKND